MNYFEPDRCNVSKSNHANNKTKYFTTEYTRHRKYVSTPRAQRHDPLSLDPWRQPLDSCNSVRTARRMTHNMAKSMGWTRCLAVNSHTNWNNVRARKATVLYIVYCCKTDERLPLLRLDMLRASLTYGLHKGDTRVLRRLALLPLFCLFAVSSCCIFLLCLLAVSSCCTFFCTFMLVPFRSGCLFTIKVGVLWLSEPPIWSALREYFGGLTKYFHSWPVAGDNRKSFREGSFRRPHCGNECAPLRHWRFLQSWP